MEIGFPMKSLLLSLLVLPLTTIHAGSCQKDTDKNQPQQKQYEMQKEPESWKGVDRLPPQVRPKEGGIFFADYLIMRAYNQDIVYTQDVHVFLSEGSFQDQQVQSEMLAPVRTWRPGFRVGFGWDMPYQGWDLQADWTYYYNKSVTNAEAKPMVFDDNGLNTGEGFVAYWAVPLRQNNQTLVGKYRNIQGVWQLNYNMINLEMGRDFQIRESLRLRPHLGLQNGWIHQKMRVLYDWGLEIRRPPNYQMDQLSVLNNKFWGMGLRGGSDIDWELGWGFSIQSQLSASILSGRTKSRRIQSTDPNNGDGFIRVYNMRDRIRQIVPGVQATLGMNWSSGSPESDMMFSLGVFWESNFWWGQFKFLRPPLFAEDSVATTTRGYSENYPMSNGGLFIEGVSVRGQFDF